jgi:membrane-associated protease RseP (regulator of RpoE activity)
LVLPNEAAAFAQGPRLGPAGRLPQIALGSLRVSNPLVYFSQGPWGNGLLGSGALGTQTLRHFQVTFDFPHERMFLEPSAYFADADEEHMSGMFLVPQEPDHKVLVVTGLIPGSPAAEAGLQVGDGVTSIDGRPASEYTVGALWTMFMHAGRRYTLSVRRGSQLITVVFITRRLV